MHSSDTDEALLERVARGDEAAARTLVARKLPRLLSLAGRLLGDRGEAEDVAQEAFLRIWQQAPHWRRDEAKFDTWLHRVAFNLCTDRLRRRRTTYFAEPPDRADPDASPDRDLALREERRTIDAALAELPERQRQAIVLQYYQELSNIDAADILGVSVEALESLLARARRNLRRLLSEGED